MKARLIQLLKQLSKSMCEICKYSSQCRDISECPIRPIMIQILNEISED